MVNLRVQVSVDAIIIMAAGIAILHRLNSIVVECFASLRLPRSMS